MPNSNRRSFLARSAAATGALFANDCFADWNQWRGPSRDGSVDDTYVWPEKLNESSLELVWEAELEPSYSGPIIHDGRVFVTETIGKKQEQVTAFNVADGGEQWKVSWPGAMRVPFFAASNGSWIRSTPAVNENFLLVGGIRDVLVCLDPKSGDEIWRNDFVTSQKAKMPDFGFVSSPLVRGDHCFVQAGGGLLKVDLATGEVVWRKLADGGGMYGSAFSSPVLTTLHEQEQLLVQTRQRLVGVDPENGETLWSTKVPSFRGMNILPPTTFGDSVFTSTYKNGSFCYQINRSDSGGYSVETKWKNRVAGYMSSPLVFDDHVYLHLGNGRLTCMDLNTGSQKWSSRPYGKYWSSISQGDRMLALDERGDLLLVKPGTESFELIGKQKVASNSWAHLAVDGDLVFVRDLNKLMVYRWKAVA